MLEEKQQWNFEQGNKTKEWSRVRSVDFGLFYGYSNQYFIETKKFTRNFGQDKSTTKRCDCVAASAISGTVFNVWHSKKKKEEKWKKRLPTPFHFWCGQFDVLVTGLKSLKFIVQTLLSICYFKLIHRS